MKAKPTEAEPSLKLSFFLRVRDHKITLPDLTKKSKKNYNITHFLN